MFPFAALFQSRKPRKTEFKILMATLAQVQTSLNTLHDTLTRKLADKDATIGARDAQIAELQAQIAAGSAPVATAADLDSIDATIQALTAQAVA